MKRGVQRMSQLPPADRAWLREAIAEELGAYELMLLGGASLAEVLARKVADDRRSEVYEAEKESGVHRIAPEATTSVSELPPVRVAGRR